jgi:ribonuclease HI
MHSMGKHDETLKHAFATCAHVAGLWKLVIDRWNRATCQELDHTDLRVTMLGDRGEQRHALTHGLWRMVHASTIWVIHHTGKSAREQQKVCHKHTSPMAMLAEVRRQLQRMVTAAWITRENGARLPWQEWQEERWIVVSKPTKRAAVRILCDGHSVAHPLPHEQSTLGGTLAPTDASGCTPTGGDVHTQRAAAELPLTWQQYTDGSWVDPEDEMDVPLAGWGVAELTTSDASDAIPLQQITSNAHTHGMAGKVTWACSGEVVTEGDEPDYLGAGGMTNNTGELSAMYYALRRAMQRPRGQGREVIWSDSLYAINMTTGKWMPRKQRNAAMVGLLRRTWRQLERRRPREATLRHVRSHVKVPGNELADHLAELGRHGTRATASMASGWLHAWHRRMMQDLRNGAASDRAHATQSAAPVSAEDAIGEG